jgi:hypothetical protein
MKVVFITFSEFGRQGAIEEIYKPPTHCVRGALCHGTRRKLISFIVVDTNS